MEVKVRMPMHAIIRHPHEPSSLLTTQCSKKFTLRDSCANQTVEDILPTAVHVKPPVKIPSAL